MTPREYAKRMGVSLRTVYRWIRAGRLPGAEAKKVGGRWRIATKTAESTTERFDMLDTIAQFDPVWRSGWLIESPRPDRKPIYLHEDSAHPLRILAAQIVSHLTPEEKRAWVKHNADNWTAEIGFTDVRGPKAKALYLLTHIHDESEYQEWYALWQSLE